ncbi:MAG: lipoyl(octanoyl) transferase LipB, partial [Nitriliruptor sp.]
GDVTYHGPGQLVGYPIWKLDGPRVVDHVRTLEEINLRLLAGIGITASRVEGFSGVWVEDAKVTAVGVHVSARYVTTHGWATNVDPDLSDFAGIVPCGLADKQVASIAALGHPELSVDDVADRTVDHVAEVLGTRVEHAIPADLGLEIPAPV